MNNEKYFWYGVGALVLVLIGGISYLVLSTAGAGPAVAKPAPAISSSDHIRGTTTAPIVLIEYSDFQCPACASYEPLLQQLSTKFGDSLALVYRHFPLTTIHKNAIPALIASEAAGQQGKFWEMHDKLFASQKDWEGSLKAAEVFRGYAQELGLDMAAYDGAVGGDTLRQFADKAFKDATDLGLSGTPSFYLNGALIDSPRSYVEFEKVINDTLGQ
jgi:protein-disulfide isomerase